MARQQASREQEAGALQARPYLNQHSCSARSQIVQRLMCCQPSRTHAAARDMLYSVCLGIWRPCHSSNSYFTVEFCLIQTVIASLLPTSHSAACSPVSVAIRRRRAPELGILESDHASWRFRHGDTFWKSAAYLARSKVPWLSQDELEKERQRAMAEVAARDVRINGLFEELTATQSEVQEMQQQLDQVRATCHTQEFASGCAASQRSITVLPCTSGSTACVAVSRLLLQASEPATDCKATNREASNPTL